MNKDDAKPWLGLLGVAALTGCGVAGPSLDGVYTASAVNFCETCVVSGSTCQCCCNTGSSGSSGAVPLVTLTITNSNAPTAQGTLSATIGGCMSIGCTLRLTRTGNSLAVSGGDCTPMGGCTAGVMLRVSGGAVTVGDLVANLDLHLDIGFSGCGSSSCSIGVTSLLSRR